MAKQKEINSYKLPINYSSIVSLIEKIKIGLNNPRLVADFVLGKKYKWTQGHDKKFNRKKYESYEEYLQHQKSKLKKLKKSMLLKYDKEYRLKLRERLKKQGIVKPGMNVLCLAARLGTEVKSFLDIGCFAVGLDLEPGAENKHVVYGDFHNIQFADHSVDAVFTNSLDHVFDFDKLIKEIKRVLKPQGLLILEIVRGKEEDFNLDYYEAAIWKKIDDVLGIFLKSGFKVIKKDNFNYPWNGQHISFRLK